MPPKLQSNTPADARANATPTLQQRKQQVVREAIWDAAMDLFEEKGYDETTVDQIAGKAGISRRSFFRYFESKTDLIAHGTRSYSNALTVAIDSHPVDCSLQAVFRQTVTRIAEQSVVDRYTRRTMEIAAKQKNVRAAQLLAMADVHDRVAEAFARRSKKRLGGNSPGILAGLTVSTLSVIFRAWFEQGRRDISGAAARVLATISDLGC